MFLKIPKFLYTQQCTRMKFFISFIANSGLHTPNKNGSSKCSILGTFVGSLEIHIHGRSRNVTTMSSQELVSHHTSTSTPSTLAGLCSQGSVPRTEPVA